MSLYLNLSGFTTHLLINIWCTHARVKSLKYLRQNFLARGNVYTNRNMLTNPALYLCILLLTERIIKMFNLTMSILFLYYTFYFIDKAKPLLLLLYHFTLTAVFVYISKHEVNIRKHFWYPLLDYIYVNLLV